MKWARRTVWCVLASVVLALAAAHDRGDPPAAADDSPVRVDRYGPAAPPTSAVQVRFRPLGALAGVYGRRVEVSVLPTGRKSFASPRPHSPPSVLPEAGAKWDAFVEFAGAESMLPGGQTDSDGDGSFGSGLFPDGWLARDIETARGGDWGGASTDTRFTSSAFDRSSSRDRRSEPAAGARGWGGALPGALAFPNDGLPMFDPAQ